LADDGWAVRFRILCDPARLAVSLGCGGSARSAGPGAAVPCGRGHSGGGAQSDARDRLWQRLLGGELTRISVACSTDSTEIYQRYIPHGLGLERIWPHAHQQDRKTGVYRTQAEMNRIADDLAAQDGWICGSGWPTWDSFFVKNSDAVLVFQTPSRAWRMRLAAARSATASAVAAVFRALLRRQPRYDDGPFLKQHIGSPARLLFADGPVRLSTTSPTRRSSSTATRISRNCAPLGDEAVRAISVLPGGGRRRDAEKVLAHPPANACGGCAGAAEGRRAVAAHRVERHGAERA